MYINSFITELSKKIDTVDEQLKDFQSKMDRITDVKNMLTLKTLKDIDDLKGEDLALLDKDDFMKILDVFNFDDKEEKMKIFFNATVSIKVNQKLVSDGEINVSNKEQIESYISWLDEQIKYIKEYIKDFNNNNKEYYNSLKISNNLYKKYISYFKNDKLIKPIYDIEEFNEVLKKSGIITSEKWQILEYIGEKNIDFARKSEADKKNDVIEYSDEEILSFVESILIREKNLINNITDDIIKTSLEILDYDDEQIEKMNLNNDLLVKYQKVPILDTMNNIYKETKEMLKEDKDSDALKIEKNLKDLLELVDSYDVIKKIES